MLHSIFLLLLFFGRASFGAEFVQLSIELAPLEDGSTLKGDGIKVFLNGDIACTILPCSENIPKGTIDITIIKEGFSKWEESRDIQESVSILVTLTPKVKVSFDSVPSGEGVKVFLGEEELCTQTPCTKKVPRGVSKVIFQKEGFFDWEKVYDFDEMALGEILDRDNTHEISITAEFIPKSLISFDSVPNGEGVKVLLDGEEICTQTPCEQELEPKESKITFQKDGYSDWIQILSLKEKIAITADLDPVSLQKGDLLYYEQHQADLQEAREYYQKACLSGSARGCLELAHLLYFSFGEKVLAKQYVVPEYLNRVDQLCSNGDHRACTRLGSIYLDGIGVEVSYEKSLSLYQKSCDGGSMISCSELAFMYRDVMKSSQKALPFFQKACEGGEPESCYLLAKEYYSSEKARFYFQKSCDTGYAKACSNLNSKDGRSNE